MASTEFHPQVSGIESAREGSKSPKIALGVWPRLLSLDLCAVYCSVSVRTLGTFCPVAPIKIGARVLYDRKALDRWLDTLSATGIENRTADEWLGKLDNVHAA